VRTEYHISEAEKISRRTEGRTEGDWEIGRGGGDRICIPNL